MKFIKAIILVSIITTGLLLACKKNELRQSPFDGVEGKALVKFNYSSPYFYKSTAPIIPNAAVTIKINGKIVSSPITYSTPYPGGGLNTGGNSYSDYLSVTPGQNTISVVIPFKGTSNDSVVFYTTQVDLKANEYQTIHITDTAANTTHMISYDPYNKPDSGWVLYRFTNLIPNAGPLDLYFGANKIASNIAFKQISDTFRLPAGNIANWSIRKKDSTSTLGSAYTGTASSVANQRVFTVYARGYDGVPITDVRRPMVSLLYNK